MIDLEQTLRGLLRGFGLKVGDVSRGKLPARVRELAAGHAMLERIVEPMLAAREAIWCEFNKLHREVLSLVKEAPSAAPTSPTTTGATSTSARAARSFYTTGAGSRGRASASMPKASCATAPPDTTAASAR